MIRRFGLLVFALPLLALAAGPVGEVFSRTPPYYTVRYGLADSTSETERWSFLHPGTDGTTEVRGKLSVRRYHSRDVKLEAVFFRPELVLAAVTIARSAGWTPADVDNLLAEYGARWRQIGAGLWISEEGVRAIHRDGAFHLLSPRIMGLMDASLAAP
jgi:hypothetical protein